MRISVIIPSLNQGSFIAETLDSVLSQKHADIEVTVFDGGSVDQTVEILRKYSKHIEHWESRPDFGQADAINKGLARMTGDVWMYLNSDDLLAPEALSRVAERFSDPRVIWISGLCETFDETGRIGGVEPRPVMQTKEYLTPWRRSSQYIFPFSGACYLRREVVDRVGQLDRTYHYCMDIEYYCRLVFQGGYSQTFVSDILACWRWQDDSKTMRRGIAYAFREEEIRIAREYSSLLPKRQQLELDEEIRLELKDLPVRKAIWALKEGRRYEALSLIMGSARKTRSIILYRPWLGALRRALFGLKGSL